MLRFSRVSGSALGLALLAAALPAFGQGPRPARPDKPFEAAPTPTPPAAEAPAPPAPAAPPPAAPAPAAPVEEKKPEPAPPPAEAPAAPAPAPAPDAAPPAEAPAAEAPPAAAPEPAPEPPKPAEPPKPPPGPVLETTDDLPDAGYLPGYSKYQGIGTSPYAPRLAGFPGGITPSFGAPSPSDSWLFTWHGYMSASLQVSVYERPDPGTGQRRLALHTPPNIIEEYSAFPSTNALPGNWIGSNFSYGNSLVTATVSVDTWNPTRPTQNYGLGSQYFINNAYLNLRVPPMGKWRLAFNVGYFSANYGTLGRYGGGFYTNPMTATIQGVGVTPIIEYDLTDTLVVAVEGGIMGLGGPRVNLLPDGVVAGTGTGGYGGESQWPAAFINHVHAGVVRKGDIQISAQVHYLSNWFQDERVQREPDEDGVCDLPDTDELNECYVRDGRMRVIGADVKMLSNSYGVLGIGGSLIDADWAFPLKGMATFAGDGERLTSAWFGTRSQGNGQLLVAGAAYNLSIASLLLAPEPFNGQAPDIVVNAGFHLGKIKTAEEPFNGRVRHKYGAEVFYTPLRYLGMGVRFDRVVPASDDDEQTFHVVAPRIQFKTDWTSHEAIVISYVKWFLGPHSHYDGLNPRSSERIDDQMFTLNFNMWW